MPYGPPPKRARKRWGCFTVALAVIALLVVIGVVAAVAGGGSDDDGDPAATEEREGGSSRSSDRDEAVSEDAEATVGEIIEGGGGQRSRVNAVTPNAPALNEFTSPDPGTTFTRLDVEQCAGSEQLATNPLYWSAQLDDRTMAEATLGAQGFETITLAPGGCQRGTVDVSVPQGRSVTAVVLTDATFSETGRWQVGASSGPPTAEALQPDEPPESAPVGEQVEAVGGRAIVHGVAPGAAPTNEFTTPDPGSSFTRLDVEVCAGDQSTPVNPLYWFGVLDDNTIASAELGAQTLQTLELAPNQCQRGTVDVVVPDGRRVVAVLFTDAGVQEAGRWSVD